MIEHGSFRDPTARVFYDAGRVLRGLNADAAKVDAAARACGLMDVLVDRGLFVENWRVDDVTVPDEVPSAAIVESRRVATINYASEWSFSMLKKAALATLDANLHSLGKGFILKDASAFNVVFEGTEPLIIDVASVDVFGERGMWTAYAQMCDHFLAPLMLEAYSGIPFQRFLRGQTEGIPIVDLNRLLRGRAGLHKGVVSHVRLRNRLEGRAEGMNTDRRREVGRLSLPRSAVIANIKRMRKLVDGLESSASSTWAAYEEATPYEHEEAVAKASFVAEAAGNALEHGLAVDVGANAGRFTRILADHFEHTVGMDFDAGAIDNLFEEAAGSHIGNITPLVVDIANPTPPFGWRGMERPGFTDRVKPDFAAWLAVVHHLSFTAGIPLESVVAQVFEFSPESVVEFVSPEDPMAQRISASRTSEAAPYSKDLFEQYVSRHGTSVAARELSPTRTIYHLRRD